MPDDASSSTATQLAQNSVFERFARAGYVVSGLLNLIIGYLAIRIALGVGAGTADQSGALAALAAKPGGIVALWAAVVAPAVMGLWHTGADEFDGRYGSPSVPARDPASSAPAARRHRGRSTSWSSVSTRKSTP